MGIDGDATRIQTGLITASLALRIQFPADTGIMNIDEVSKKGDLFWLRAKMSTIIYLSRFQIKSKSHLEFGRESLIKYDMCKPI